MNKLQSEGRAAHKAGLKWWNNPHPSGSAEAHAWDQGHTSARTRVATVEVLPVLFRAERYGASKGDVTAVFPTQCADYAGREMTCYAHIGQHSGCSLDWYRDTRPARPAEYADLLAELRGIYERDGDVVLQVRLRITDAMRGELRASARAAQQSLRDDPRGAPWIPAAAI